MSAAAILPARRPARVLQWTRAAAVLVLGLAAIGVWWPVLGSEVLWVTPVLLLAAAVAGNVIELRDARVRALFPWLWLVWTPVAYIVAGLPASALNPLIAGDTLRTLAEALAAALREPSAVADPWTLAAWLQLCGVAWFVGAGWARREHRVAVAAAFVLLATPFALALAFGRTGDAAWQGGAILVGGLLWATRGNLRDGLPALAVVAVAGVAVAAVVAPTERWSGLDPQNRGKQPFTELSSEQTYGPAPQRTTGATMFEIEARRPSLWRMEVLERYDGRVWGSEALPSGRELPQPQALLTTSTVRLVGLQNNLAVAPGRIESLTGTAIAGAPRRPSTEAVPLVPRPRPGQVYSVVSAEVQPSADLATVRVPTGAEYRRLTAVLPGTGFPNPAVGRVPASQRATAYGRLTQLAEQLTAGTDSELEMVSRVQAYLRDSGLFRYTLDVDEPGPLPVVDFLLNSRRGYCQHFAGGAALLLRLAGVPTRVVTGFATGMSDGRGRWKVRDEDAHAWIEVYFPGHGWVAFNPTPGAADAAIAPGVGDTDEEAAAARRSVAGAKVPVGLVAAVLAVVGAALLLAAWRRRPATDPDALGDVLARIVPAPAEPSMTFAALRDDLRELGPAVTALADEAERQRFGPPGQEPARHPRRRVLRALLSDVGPARTAQILLLGPGRRPVVGGGPKVTQATAPVSVAPPPRHGRG